MKSENSSNQSLEHLNNQSLEQSTQERFEEIEKSLKSLENRIERVDELEGEEILDIPNSFRIGFLCIVLFVVGFFVAYFWKENEFKTSKLEMEELLDKNRYDIQVLRTIIEDYKGGYNEIADYFYDRLDKNIGTSIGYKRNVFLDNGKGMIYEVENNLTESMVSYTDSRGKQCIVSVKLPLINVDSPACREFNLLMMQLSSKIKDEYDEFSKRQSYWFSNVDYRYYVKDDILNLTVFRYRQYDETGKDTLLYDRLGEITFSINLNTGEKVGQDDLFKNFGLTL